MPGDGVGDDGLHFSGDVPEPPGSPFPFTGKRRRLPDEGEVEVFVTDEQDAVPVDAARWQRLAAGVLTDEGIVGDAELSLLFVDETAMGELNARFMAAEGPTDVLAFPLEDDLAEPGRFPDSGSSGPVDPRMRGEPTDVPLLLGDVVICPAVAARNASDHARSYDDEVALLVVHGVLHVLGHDHAEPEAEAAMKAREQELLARHHRSDGQA